MSDNDIEKELKYSADKITVKNFSERWDNIKDDITSGEEEQEILLESPVFAANGNNTVGSFGNSKRNLLISVLTPILCVIVILAVVLPLTLRKNKEPSYFDPADLECAIVDGKEQFFAAIENKGYELIDISGYEIEECMLLVTSADKEVRGGKFSLSSDEFICYVSFYDSSVSVKYDFNNFQSYTAGSTEIKYNTKSEDSIYKTEVYTQYKNIIYIMEYLSVSDNCTVFFEEVFS